MTSALTILLVASVAGLLAALIFWPNRGGPLWYLIGLRHTNERTRVEDALKHIHECEYHGYPCSLARMASALKLSGREAMALLSRLAQLTLVDLGEDRFRLTPQGRSEALRIIRVHRLLERYLAAETALKPSQWHVVADRLEHTTSPAQVRHLAARMGHPRFDPHGDPIPSPTGDIPPRRGLPLTHFEEGARVKVVHMEDEPAEVYAQLVAQGIYVGMRLRLFERNDTRLRCEADEEEFVLAPSVAQNLSVEPCQAADIASSSAKQAQRLSSLQPGIRARVTAIAPACSGLPRRRLLDLGFVPSSEVTAELRSASGDPTAYRVRGTLIALRREQSDMIFIEGLSS